jgi:hypothetical protein
VKFNRLDIKTTKLEHVGSGGVSPHVILIIGLYLYGVTVIDKCNVSSLSA